MKERDQFSEKEASRRDDLLLKMLKTPPQPRPKRERPKQKKKGRTKAAPKR